MAKLVKEIFESNIWLRVLTIVAVLLLIAGFILPPLAHIDASVLTACGELAGFGALWIVLLGIEKGVEVSATKGDTKIEVHKQDN